MSELVRLIGPLHRDMDDAAAWALLRAQEYADALIQDFEDLDETSAGQVDQFFGHVYLPQRFLLRGNPSRSVTGWSAVLDRLRHRDEGKYRRMHKGTPFYWLAVAGFLSESFDAAMFYLDAAVDEDAAIAPNDWHRRPAGLFLGFDPVPEDQAARDLVAQASVELRQDGALLRNGGIVPFTEQDLRERVVRRAVDEKPGLRSVAPALICFILEHRSRVRELEHAPRRGPGSASAMFMGLFRGSLVFESLLRLSPQGAASGQTTMGRLLTDGNVLAGLGFKAPVQGFGSVDLNHVLAWMNGPPEGLSPSEAAARVTLGVRNTTGHSLGWPEPTLEEYRSLHFSVLGAISAAIIGLYDPV